jgi:hypothetical protein
MALTVSISKTDSVGRYLKVKTGTVTFDSSYPTGGESLSATDLGFSTKEAEISDVFKRDRLNPIRIRMM